MLNGILCADVPLRNYLLTHCLMLVGFSELCQDDQIKLIKQGSFEVILARYVPLFTDDGMFVPDMSVKVPRFVLFSPCRCDLMIFLLACFSSISRDPEKSWKISQVVAKFLIHFQP